MEVSDRFWSKVDIRGESECWEWTATRHPRGYGVFWFNGKNVRANRYALEQTEDVPFDGAICLHSCDNPPCCNPAHLRWGTHQDNVDDKLLRRGPMKGEQSAHAKITNHIVAEIYRGRLDGLTISEISESLSLPDTTVENVYVGRAWQHRLGVDGNPTLEQLRASKPKRKRHAHNRKVSEDMVDRILKGRMAEKSAKCIANELGLPLGTVSPIYSGLAFTERHGVNGNPTLDELRSVSAPNPTHILTDDDISEIKTLLDAGYVGKDIAERYGISRALVSNIKNGKR